MEKEVIQTEARARQMISFLQRAYSTVVSQKVFKNFDTVDDEVRPFAEDPSLQLLIQYQIQAEQEAKALSDYQYDQKQFPSLISTDKLKEINRKNAFKLSDWNKSKSVGKTGKSGDILEDEAIDKIKKAFPLLNTEI